MNPREIAPPRLEDAVYEWLPVHDGRCHGNVGSIGIYTGLGVAGGDEPDIIIDFDYLDTKVEEDGGCTYAAGLRVVLPGEPIVVPVLNAVLEVLRVCHVREELDQLTEVLSWCGRRLQPMSDEAMEALGYVWVDV